jgi:hypothetical protein
VFEDLTAFARGDAGDKLSAIFQGQLGVTGAEIAGDALDEETGLWSNENGHLTIRI